MSSADRLTATLRPQPQREITARRPGRVVLQVASAGARRTAEIASPRLTIGAHASNGLTVNDDAVSSMHCELELKDDGEEGAMLRDLGSKNGTWVDDIRIKEIWLPLGRSFCIGSTTITLTEIGTVDVPISMVTNFGQLYGRGPKMGELYAKLMRLADVPLDVLCVGETGTGKELIARGIHEQSSRRNGSFVVVDCTILNEGIAESILFGHCKGSFTDASRDQPGLLEQADGGTLFLDEIGELPLEIQPKLLRALELRETRRIGEYKYRGFDARIIAATNRDLPRMVCEGTFRADLYFRVSSMTLRIPPLRDRGSGNIGMLADLFLQAFAKERGRSLRFEKAVYALLDSYRWPGNVRQLRNTIRTVAMMSESGCIRSDDVPCLDEASTKRPIQETHEHRDSDDIHSILDLPWSAARKALGKLYAERVLKMNDGNQTHAARQAGLSRTAFRAILKPTDDE